MAVSGVTDSTSSTSSGTATKKLTDNFDTFLTMLTVQLKNQDPLSPMDSTEFTNQLVQFSAVEQQINTNKNLESLLSATKTNAQAQAISYLGREIEVASSAVPLQDGKANFSYTLPEDAKAITVVVKDADGKLVANLKAESSKGRHEATWDGKNTDGKQLEDGYYKIEITATKADGTKLEAGTTVYGHVTDVASDQSGTLIAMGKVVTTVENILTVREKPTTNTTTTTTGTTN